MRRQTWRTPDVAATLRPMVRNEGTRRQGTCPAGMAAWYNFF